LTFREIAFDVRYIRANTLDQMSAEYVLVQRAYGASKAFILFRHVMKHVLLPLITFLGLSLPELFAGAIVVETVFSWPGMGSLTMGAITGLDYPVLLGVTILAAAALILGNLLADILYRVADPRIQY
jgi:peptide/nickel transport system permease protein